MKKQFRVNLNESTIEKVDEIAAKTHRTRRTVMELAVENLYQELENSNN